jgi:hypothetical protein
MSEAKLIEDLISDVENMEREQRVGIAKAMLYNIRKDIYNVEKKLDKLYEKEEEILNINIDDIDIEYYSNRM